MVHYEYPAADWLVGAQLRPAAEVPVQVTDYALRGGAVGGLDLNQAPRLADLVAPTSSPNSVMARLRSSEQATAERGTAVVIPRS